MFNLFITFLVVYSSIRPQAMLKKDKEQRHREYFQLHTGYPPIKQSFV